MPSDHMQLIDPSEKTAPEMHQLLVGTVAPRPIALVSTTDQNGKVNLAPYSFFNVFSSKPPILVFSAALRGNDSSAKDTLINVQQTREVVINVVPYAIARQMAITSIQFPPEVDEFSKSGFTPVDSVLVRPPRVAESPVHFECAVMDIIPMGAEGGAGNLILCEAKKIHLSPSILDTKGRIDPHRLDLMGRMGRAFYARASGEAIHRIYQPTNVISIGFDHLPASAKNSTLLTGNDLGMLAGLENQPSLEEVANLKQHPDLQDILNAENPVVGLHHRAKILLKEEQIAEAAKLIWLAEDMS